ncbi:MAG: hypothetical protein JWR63_4526 [Conexibacter sp.]|nr:hypothetical protein [Conexibacter sp.]
MPNAAPSRDDVRRARSIVLSGEILRIELEVQPIVPDAPQGWSAALTDAKLRAEIVAKVDAAAKKALGKGFVTLMHPPTGATDIRVSLHAQQRGPAAFLEDDGAKLETKILDLLSRISRKLSKLLTTRTSTTVTVVGQWSAADGLEIVDSPPTVSGPALEIENQVEVARSFKARLDFVGAIGAAGVLLMPLLALVAVLALDDNNRLLALLPGGYALLFAWLVWLARNRRHDLDLRVEDLRDQQDLVELVAEDRERRAQKLFQVHSRQLKRYYDQALRHRGVIFASGLLCIFGGFAVVGAAFVVIAHADDTTEKIVAAALGAIGGVLANFIAVIYLRMFSQTVDSIGAFHDRLVVTHHLHFANFLLAKVGDARMRDEALATVSTTIAELDVAHPSKEPPEPKG